MIVIKASRYLLRLLPQRDALAMRPAAGPRKHSRSSNPGTARFTVEDHVAATAGVECRKDADVIDETPGVYKSID